MLYSDVVPLIYVNKTICVVICPSTRFKSIILWPGMNYLVSFWVLRYSFLFINRLLVRQWHPTPVLLPGKSHGWRSLVGYNPWGRYESDTTEQLHFHFSLSCIGEGNGNPLQCSGLENPRGGGAWWAAVYGVAQSRTRLKGLSSSSNSSDYIISSWRLAGGYSFCPLLMPMSEVFSISFIL